MIHFKIEMPEGPELKITRDKGDANLLPEELLNGITETLPLLSINGM